ncbi:hypothetical protein H8356DRAFT_1361553 [Neocallimastix lanati (nom. inval.)]|nr:hypothetical protein H8356DRAFT_1361553 [Neocallimastix sp. JGI-2020a]
MLKRYLRIKKKDITKISTIIKKSKSNKRVDIKGNFNKETNSNKYCPYCHKNGHTTDNYNLLSRKGTKRNLKSYNVNYEGQNNIFIQLHSLIRLRSYAHSRVISNSMQS